MLLERALTATVVVALTGSFVFSLVAVRGFWDAPFGDVLRPLPIAFAGFLAAVAPELLGVPVPTSFLVVTATGAVLASFVAAVQGVVLLTGWRDV
ncbi:MAG: hypothetical protein ABEH90_06895 [Halolamina sp.]